MTRGRRSPGSRIPKGANIARCPARIRSSPTVPSCLGSAEAQRTRSRCTQSAKRRRSTRPAAWGPSPTASSRWPVDRDLAFLFRLESTLREQLRLPQPSQSLRRGERAEAPQLLAIVRLDVEVALLAHGVIVPFTRHGERAA